ncbi:uncharacterized protein PGTG_12974 [Puccinia graminis f. sp. tritici CRL 75-36-700-3]|uniref:Uncharacterized protein n=1 Tax=Puccinia graminis f. sp. tritici (strain CRL 75-36-700-3 / race SCCL) TaxID=418459 RepID=E3KQL7_PUCGT|nr:uncharacterized protein PGTG_12974 [Puccinia graminis f. sp. tritici CRL 75-36-700-3]EFP86592.2 hypothetical protein PGTG_12974 [Puccinia graminis f. sp. tritici CRL 75-36-700-3]
MALTPASRPRRTDYQLVESTSVGPTKRIAQVPSFSESPLTTAEGRPLGAGSMDSLRLKGQHTPSGGRRGTSVSG